MREDRELKEGKEVGTAELIRHQSTAFETNSRKTVNAWCAQETFCRRALRKTNYRFRTTDLDRIIEHGNFEEPRTTDQSSFEEEKTLTTEWLESIYQRTSDNVGW
ncbi:uncharacterized protein LOC117237402 [Bombus vosnesenskii]|uniref:Uncharacterized protein LOC117237402 n=1 Tax=Bombus vosnesenskii TaxID=207650 RepID=A0A6J3KW88_9HYME|nr:uncharacterized protein LOC117237402 [Bombus vosnesenskii]